MLEKAKVIDYLNKTVEEAKKIGGAAYAIAVTIKCEVDQMPNALPCKIGDVVWFVRQYHGTKKATHGVVKEMFYLNDMRLVIVVGHVGRGCWGDRVFATREEAEAACK